MQFFNEVILVCFLSFNLKKTTSFKIYKIVVNNLAHKSTLKLFDFSFFILIIQKKLTLSNDLKHFLI